MPNNTDCVLRVTGPKAARDAFRDLCEGVDAVYAPYQSPLTIKNDARVKRLLAFNQIVPIPETILTAGYSDVGYNWQINNWGTKWNAYDIERFESEESLLYTFTTAWSPPMQWLRVAADRFPTLQFELWARDEWPYCVSVKTYFETYDNTRVWQECYGESVDKNEK